MNKKAPPFATLSTRVVWSCPWYTVRQDRLRLPDGQPGVYNVVQHPGAVWVVPVTPDGEIVLLYHYRYTVDDWCWEVPAGGLREGQQAEVVARQELQEEIGGKATGFHYIGQFYTSNGISNEVAYIYLASGVTLGKTAHEPAEVIEVHRKPVAEVLRMAHQNQISDGPSALALLLCEPHLERLVSSMSEKGEGVTLNQE